MPSPLIRLECSNASRIGPFAEELEAERDRFLATNTVNFQNEVNLSARLPHHLTFFALPEQQLLAYEKHRETSELGQIFRIANGLHDFIDAVVITGHGGGWSGAKAIAEACCDPFHNETHRAARGSKPRIYFAGNDFDNDSLHSLVGRLIAGGYGDGPAESKWAMICSHRSGQSNLSRSQTTLLSYLMDHLRENRSTDSTEVQSRLVTSIGCEHNPVSQHLQSSGCHQMLRVPENIKDPFTILTPVGLLSSAFLGLDVIQLLVGAAAINDNFRTARFDDNVVLQFVAANCRPERNAPEHDCPTTVFGWWPRSLVGFNEWLQWLRPVDWSGATAALDVGSESGRHLLSELVTKGTVRPQNLRCNHITVDAIRTDRIDVGDKQSPLTSKNAISVPTLQKETFSMTESMIDQLGIPQTTVSLPVIDTHSLGQLIQMLMIASAIGSSDKENV